MSPQCIILGRCFSLCSLRTASVLSPEACTLRFPLGISRVLHSPNAARQWLQVCSAESLRLSSPTRATLLESLQLQEESGTAAAATNQNFHAMRCHPDSTSSPSSSPFFPKTAVKQRADDDGLTGACRRGTVAWRNTQQPCGRKTLLLN